jgi:hypothetical protein
MVAANGSRRTRGSLRNEVLKRLFRGADSEVQDRRVWMLLSWVAEYEHEVVMKLLLEKWADMESKSSSGWTPVSLQSSRSGDHFSYDLIY